MISITIKTGSPICFCEVNNLSWTMEPRKVDDTFKQFIILTCNTCKTSISALATANLKRETGYKYNTEQEKEKALALASKENVIQFPFP